MRLSCLTALQGLSSCVVYVSEAATLEKTGNRQLITSRVSGRGYRIVAVFLCVCVCVCVCVSVRTLTAKPFDEFVCVFQSITKKGLLGKRTTIWETRKVRERSGVFILNLFSLLNSCHGPSANTAIRARYHCAYHSNEEMNAFW